MLPDEAMEAVHKHMRSIVGTIRCNLFAYSDFKYGLRDLTQRSLTFLQSHLRFFDIHTVHVNIIGADWEEAAKLDFVHPIAARQAELEAEQIYERQARARGREAAREIGRLMADFRGIMHEDDDSEVSDDDDDDDDHPNTREARILKGQTDAIDEAWSELSGSQTVRHYDTALLGIYFSQIPRMLGATYYGGVSKFILEFHDMNDEQLSVFRMFLRGTPIVRTDGQEDDLKLKEVEVRRVEERTEREKVCKKLVFEPW